MEVGSEVSFIWNPDRNQPGLIEALDRYLEPLRRMDRRWELVVVLDGPPRVDPRGNGHTPDLSQAVRERVPEARIIELHGRNDSSASLRAGVSGSSGDIVALLPPYVQSDPQSIEVLLQRIEEGMDYVSTWRSPRIDSRLDRKRSWLYNRITRSLSGVELHDINSGLRVMRREVLERIPLYGDLHRFLPILAARQGFKVGDVPTRHLEERVEDSGPGIYLRRALDLLNLFFIINFTRKPLRFFGIIGTATMAAGAGVLLWLGFERLRGVGLLDRPLLLLGMLLLVLGIQLFSLGLLGELMIFTHAREMKDYHVETMHGT